MVIADIGKFFHRLIERSSVWNSYKLVHSFFKVLKYLSIGALSYGHPDLLMLCVTWTDSQNSTNALDVIDTMKRKNGLSDYMEQIKANIDYDSYMHNNDYHDKELYREPYEIIYEVVCIKRESVRAGGKIYPYEQVKERFLTLKTAPIYSTSLTVCRIRA